MLRRIQMIYTTPSFIRGKPMSRFVALAAYTMAIAITVLFVAACSKTGSEKTAVTVAVAKAAVEDLSRDLSLTAELRPFQEIEVMAKVAGYVKAIYVDIGDRVKKGQLLAVLEVPEMADDLTVGKDELRRAQAAHDIADLSFKRLSQVAAQRPGLVAQQEIDDARSRDLVAEAQVAAARAALGRIKTMLDYSRVTAPFDGVVTKRYADIGSMIQAGTASQTQAMPLVRLSENSMLRLIVPVPESAVPTVHIGQQVDGARPDPQPCVFRQGCPFHQQTFQLARAPWTPRSMCRIRRWSWFRECTRK